MGLLLREWRAVHSLLHSPICLYDVRNLYEGSSCYLAMYVHDGRLFTLAHADTQHQQFGISYFCGSDGSFHEESSIHSCYVV